jgi:hypothetical protein
LGVSTNSFLSMFVEGVQGNTLPGVWGCPPKFILYFIGQGGPRMNNRHEFQNIRAKRD